MLEILVTSREGPGCAAVDAAYLSGLALGPGLEAFTVDVVAASGTAPDDVVAGLEFHDADRTFALNHFALAGIIRGPLRSVGGLRCGRGCCKDHCQF